MNVGLAASDLDLFGPSSTAFAAGAAGTTAKEIGGVLSVEEPETCGCGGCAIEGVGGTLLGERSPLGGGGAFAGGDLKGGLLGLIGIGNLLFGSLSSGSLGGGLFGAGGGPDNAFARSSAFLWSYASLIVLTSGSQNSGGGAFFACGTSPNHKAVAGNFDLVGVRGAGVIT